MPPKLAPVTQLYDANNRDVPARLRQLADTIEALPGTVQCGVVTYGDDGLAVYAFGAFAQVPASELHLMLGAAQTQLEMALIKHG
jgi:hypothetical protein